MPQARAKVAEAAKMTTTSPYRQGRASGTMRPSPRVQASSSEANRMPANSSRRLGALYQIKGKAMTGRQAGATGVDAGTGDRASIVTSPPAPSDGQLLQRVATITRVAGD